MAASQNALAGTRDLVATTAILVTQHIISSLLLINCLDFLIAIFFFGGGVLPKLCVRKARQKKMMMRKMIGQARNLVTPSLFQKAAQETAPILHIFMR